MSKGFIATISAAIINWLRPYAAANDDAIPLTWGGANERPSRPVAPPMPVIARTLGERGATPRHYRAFSLLEPRAIDRDFRRLVVSFRQRAKTLKLEESQPVREEALRLLDHFADLVDRYVGISDDAKPDQAVAYEARLSASIQRLDASLEHILASAGADTDGFDTAVRFVELRYDPTTQQDPFQLAA